MTRSSVDTLVTLFLVTIGPFLPVLALGLSFEVI